MAVLRSGNHHAHSTDEEAEAREGNPRRREPGWGCCSSDMEACCCSSQKPGWARTGQNPATIPSSHRPDTKGDHRLHLHVVKSGLYPWAHIIFLLSLLTSSSPPLTSELCFPEHPPLVCREGSAQPQGDRQSQRPQWYCLYLLDFRQGGTTIFEISYLAGRIVKFVSSQNKLNCDFCFMKKKKKSDR